jgi:hypothetical protein
MSMALLLQTTELIKKVRRPRAVQNIYKQVPVFHATNIVQVKGGKAKYLTNLADAMEKECRQEQK